MFILDTPDWGSDNLPERVKDTDTEIQEGFQNGVHALLSVRRNWNWYYFTLQNYCKVMLGNEPLVYNSETSYSLNAFLVLFDDPNVICYVSVIDNNKGNEPPSSPTAWTRIYSFLI